MTVCEGWTILDRPDPAHPWALDHIGPAYPSLDYAERQAGLEAATHPGRQFMVVRLTAATDVITVPAVPA